MISKNAYTLRINANSFMNLLQFIFAIYIFYSIVNYDIFRSYDSNFYYNYFEDLKNYSIHELHEQANVYSIYPYFYINNYDVEFGFAYLTKIISLLLPGGSEYSYAFFAALSFYLRYLIMQRMNVNYLLGILINLYAISLFEMNALRLGIAATFLCYSLFYLFEKNYAKSIILAMLALTMHAQISFFIFIFFLIVAINYLTNYYMGVINIVLNLIYGLFIGFILVVFIPFIAPSIDKLNTYYDIYSQTVGLSFTSIFCLFISILSLFSISKNRDNAKTVGSKVFILAICSTFISFTMFLVFTTIYGTVSQRAFQIAFLIFAITTCSKYFAYEKNNRFRNIGVATLCMILNINTYIRYPTSNLIAPPFPAFVDLRRE